RGGLSRRGGIGKSPQNPPMARPGLAGQRRDQGGSRHICPIKLHGQRLVAFKTGDGAVQYLGGFPVEPTGVERSALDERQLGATAGALGEVDRLTQACGRLWQSAQSLGVAKLGERSEE